MRSFAAITTALLCVALAAFGQARTPTDNATSLPGQPGTRSMSVQGTDGGVVQVGGTVTASNPSVGTIDAGTPDSGTLVGIDVGGVLKPLQGTTNGAKVDVQASALPTGASTAAKQPALGTAGTAATDVLTVQGIASMTALKTDGSAVTQPVSAASLPLPTGASTAAKQPALGTAGTASADVITVQGKSGMTALVIDGSGVTQPVSGTFWQATQPVSGTFWQATQPVSGTFWQATQPVSGTVAATESGTWNITNVSGTVSLPTGASTEATLAKLTLAQESTTSAQTGPICQGAVTTAAPTYTNAKTDPLSLQVDGALRVHETGTANVSAAQSGAWNVTNVSGTVSLPTGAATEATLATHGVTQGSTTSGQVGTLVQGAVTTSAPNYTTAQTSPISLTTTGAVRTTITDSPTVIAGPSQSIIGGVQLRGADGLSKASVGKDGTLAANLASINGLPVQTGPGPAAAFPGGPSNVERVAVASDSNVNVVLGGHPTRWDSAATCSAKSAETLCKSAPLNGTLHLTGVYFSANAAITIQITKGTGTNCGTSNAAVTPVFYMAANTGGSFSFTQAIDLPAATDVCCKPSGASGSCFILGYSSTP